MLDYESDKYTTKVEHPRIQTYTLYTVRKANGDIMLNNEPAFYVTLYVETKYKYNTNVHDAIDLLKQKHYTVEETVNEENYINAFNAYNREKDRVKNLWLLDICREYKINFLTDEIGIMLLEKAKTGYFEDDFAAIETKLRDLLLFVHAVKSSLRYNSIDDLTEIIQLVINSTKKGK